MTLDSLCRLCASTDLYCVQVFHPEGDRHLLNHKLRVCVPVTVREDDVLPKQVCLTCLSTIDAIYEFHQKSKYAQLKLTTLMKAGPQKRRHTAETDSQSKRLCTSSDLTHVPGSSSTIRDVPAVTKDPPLFARMETGNTSTDTVKATSPLLSGDTETPSSESPHGDKSGEPQNSLTLRSVISKICEPAKKELLVSKSRILEELSSPAVGISNLNDNRKKVSAKYIKKLKLEPQSPLKVNSQSSSSKTKKNEPSVRKLDSSLETSVPCPHCKREMPVGALKEHVKKFHKEELTLEPQFHCTSCPKSFYVEVAYHRHLQRHHTNSDTSSGSKPL